LRESQQLFVSLRTYEKCIDSLERDMNASDARVSAPPLSSKTVVKQLSCAGLIVARAQEAASRDALRGILRRDAKRALDCAHDRARLGDLAAHEVIVGCGVGVFVFCSHEVG
jgi:hypothetical protein